MRRLGLGLMGLILAAAVGATGAGLGASSSSAATTPGSAGTRTASEQARPNVVMIVVDDMREDELQYMPRTRRLLGGEGVRFRNSFAPYPLCCPARASYFTGQYTHNHRVFDVNEPYGFPALQDRSTLATWLQDAGYATVLLGKYMNGYGYMPEPGRTTGDSLDYVPPGWTQWRASIDKMPRSHPDHGGTYFYNNTTISKDGEGFENFKGRYQTDVYGQLSARIIERRAASEKPFFLYASYTAPHTGFPVEPDDITEIEDSEGRTSDFDSPARPERVKGMFDDVITEAPGARWRDPDPSDKPDYLRKRPPPTRQELRAMLQLSRQRAESLYVVDQAVGRTISALRRSGELRNTVVVFTSDNGYFIGEQGIRQGKTLPYEPSLRTPTLMRGPGIPAGETRRDPFLSIDFAPTIAELAGATPGIPVDGVSMVDVARHGDEGWSRAVLTETGPRRVIRSTDEAGQPLAADDPGQPDIRWAIGIRTPRYLYVSLATDEEELYDIEQDPQQYVNLAENPRHAEVLEQLRGELARMRACDAEQCRSPMSGRLQ